MGRRDDRMQSSWWGWQVVALVELIAASATVEASFLFRYY